MKTPLKTLGLGRKSSVALGVLGGGAVPLFTVPLKNQGAGVKGWKPTLGKEAGCCGGGLNEVLLCGGSGGCTGAPAG